MTADRAQEVKEALVNGSDDEGCAWLCQTAGRRTRAERRGLSDAIQHLQGAS